MLFGTKEKGKPFPELDFKHLSSSVKKMNKHYNGNFGLKYSMVNTFTGFKNDVLDENPLPNKAFKGKNDWYFLGDQWNILFKDNFGNFDYTKQELIEIKEYLQTLKEGLASRGVEFYIVVPPNKHRIYSEELPFQLQQNNTRLEVLNSYLKKEIDFEIIYLRDTLIANKKESLLYYKTNTHWNDIGAFIGYQKTINTIDPNIFKANFTDYNIDYNSSIKGDITNMINLKNDESAIILKKKTSYQVKSIKSTYQFEHFENSNQDKKLVMYRDSFATSWIQFFNESFGETIYLRDYNVDYSFIDHEKPDVVIFEVVERNLSSILLNKK